MLNDEEKEINENFDYQKPDNLFDTEDEDIINLMTEYDLDQDTAERTQEIMDEIGVDEDDAIELAEEGF